LNYFFDTSAIVKIYHREEESQKVLDILESEGRICFVVLAPGVPLAISLQGYMFGVFAALQTPGLKSGHSFIFNRSWKN